LHLEIKYNSIEA